MKREDGLSAIRWALLAAWCAGAAGCAVDRVRVGPEAPYEAVARELSGRIGDEMRTKELPALSIALVEDQRIVWAAGFGLADPEKRVRASAETIYRVGSVSKLFTDIGLAQLVERGAVELDAPVSRYLPDFHPGNPFDKPITLRQLMTHRSGLVREPPVGHYFDATGPTLAETVASLNATQLIYEPETRTKYSNAAIATVGYVLEKLSAEPFAEYLEREVLEPMGLENSSFGPEGIAERRKAKGFMWSYDGREIATPEFELGMAPAGSLYTSVLDLGRFMSVLFGEGETAEGRVLRPETLAEMMRPQFDSPDSRSAYGLGFRIGELAGRRRVGHGGAIYGFATELAMLPDEKIGVVVVTTMDAANSVTRRLADEALTMMLAVRSGEKPEAATAVFDLPPETASRLEGRFASGGRTLDLVEREGRIFVHAGTERRELKRWRDAYIVDGRLGWGPVVRVLSYDELEIGGERWNRLEEKRPPEVPEPWRGLIGEYGWDHNVLFILEKQGRLHALIEWFWLEPLTEVALNEFAFRDEGGLYHGESLKFKREGKAPASEVTLSGVVFVRRETGGEEGETFRIEPVQDPEALRRIALAAEPPAEGGMMRTADLVELTDLDPTILLDIRYATTNNFMSTIFYREGRAFMQRPAAEALVRAHQKLSERGYGLLVHDAYRPWHVTKMFWDATPEESKIFVADPARGSRHNRGCAVDVTLYDLRTSLPITMVGGYDEFSERSYPDYPGGTESQRWHRELLRDAIEAEGFEVYEFEWWHFDYKDSDKYPIMNLRFDEIAGSRR